MILYFTGTGNSRYAAQIIARITGDELVSINDISRERVTSPFTARYAFESDKPFVIVCPTYCGRTPKPVDDFLRDSRFVGSRDVYFYLTCGAATGDAESYARKLSSELGLNFMGIASARMPDNYLLLYEPSDYDEAQGMLRACVPQIESNARLIMYGKPIHDTNANYKFMSKLAPLMYKYYISDKKFRAGNNCIGCGKCEDVCPLANIAIVDGKPQWSGSCTHCVACISICPEEAIEYGRVSNKRRRYYLYEDGTQKK